MAPCKPPLNPDVISALDGLMIWSDASWKVELNYAGFVIFFANAAIDWQSKLLKVMLSSAEAEVGAGALACKRAIYLRHLIGEVTPLPALPIPHIVDHSALPPLSENLGVSRKTEHFRRWLHFMRYCVLHNYVCALDKVRAHVSRLAHEGWRQVWLPLVPEGCFQHCIFQIAILLRLLNLVRDSQPLEVSTDFEPFLNFGYLACHKRQGLGVLLTPFVAFLWHGRFM